MDAIAKMLKELSEAPGVSGYEREVRKIIRRYVEPYAAIEQDRLGSLVARRTGTGDRPRVMLAAHMDEIGFMVKSITPEGFLRFLPLGGWFDQVMLAQRVVVKTASGDVPGIIGSKPPHLLTEEERKKVVEKKEMFIDVGATSFDQATNEFGIRPGDPVIPESGFQILKNEKVYMGKAWDDRVGCAILIDVLRNLHAATHPNTVYAVATVQEEVGLRGAETSSDVVDPDVAFALEVGIANDTPGGDKEKVQERMGAGPVILIYDRSLVPNIKLRDLVIDTAKAHDIPYQIDFMEGGAADTGRIHLHGRGVPSVVIGVPSRYIHSHASLINRDDYDRTVALVTEVIKRLDAATVAELVS
ncbi:MAG TPA: M42 family metallopeptidase [Firmicutes bacterium]|nr:M42 family metallopeptidase [Bacillota bacterium]